MKNNFFVFFINFETPFPLYIHLSSYSFIIKYKPGVIARRKAKYLVEYNSFLSSQPKTLANHLPILALDPKIEKDYADKTCIIRTKEKDPKDI